MHESGATWSRLAFEIAHMTIVTSECQISKSSCRMENLSTRATDFSPNSRLASPADDSCPSDEACRWFA